MTNNGTAAPGAVDGAADNATALGKSKWNHHDSIGGTTRPIRNRPIFYHDRVFVAVLCAC